MRYDAPSGRSMTETEFLAYFEKKVRKTIRTNRLLAKKEKLMVACSGGKDSTTVLYLLHKIIRNKSISMEAIHIDANVGSYSSTNRRNIRNFCKNMGIALHESSFRQEFNHTLPQILAILKYPKPCTVCGILRRHLLNRKARELKATKLVTGHNLDDEAQVIIMNLFKNSMPLMARLGPISKSQKGFVPRIKPLYFCSEKETELYSKVMQFPVNYSKCPYRIEAYRKEIAEMLDRFEKSHAQTKYSIVRSLLEILPVLEKKYKGAAAICSRCNEPSAGKICNACKILEILD